MTWAGIFAADNNDVPDLAEPAWCAQLLAVEHDRGADTAPDVKNELATWRCIGGRRFRDRFSIDIVDEHDGPAQHRFNSLGERFVAPSEPYTLQNHAAIGCAWQLDSSCDDATRKARVSLAQQRFDGVPAPFRVALQASFIKKRPIDCERCG